MRRQSCLHRWPCRSCQRGIPRNWSPLQRLKWPYRLCPSRNRRPQHRYQLRHPSQLLQRPRLRRPPRHLRRQQREHQRFLRPRPAPPVPVVTIRKPGTGSARPASMLCSCWVPVRARQRKTLFASIPALRISAISRPCTKASPGLSSPRAPTPGAVRPSRGYPVCLRHCRSRSPGRAVWAVSSSPCASRSSTPGSARECVLPFSSSLSSLFPAQQSAAAGFPCL